MNENPAAFLPIERLSFRTDPANCLLPCRVTGAVTLDYAGASQPASGVDFYDFIPFEPHGLVAAIGRVSGRSAAATLLIPALRGFLRARLPAGTGDLRTAIRDLNHMLCGMSPDSFYATLFCAVFHSDRRALHYVNAGHEPALLLRHGDHRVHHLGTTGTVLGLTARAAYGSRTIPLEAGDVLSAFTEGVVEAADATGRPFGEPGVLKVMRDHAGEPASVLAPCLLDAVKRFSHPARPAADRTAMAVRFNHTVANAIVDDEKAEAAFAAA